MDEGKKTEYTYVFLRPAVDEDGNLSHRMFYCPNCRNGVLNITGRVAMIMPGNEPHTDGVMKSPFVARCGGKHEVWGRCPARFSFEGYVE